MPGSSRPMRTPIRRFERSTINPLSKAYTPNFRLPRTPELSRAALAARGIARLYSHQAEAFEAVGSGKNVAVVTPTASGKTLCYNLPVLNLLLSDPQARAMYLFPTKALAEDQLHEFHSLVEEMGSDLRAFTYDGDTPQDARKAVDRAPTLC